MSVPSIVLSSILCAVFWQDINCSNEIGNWNVSEDLLQKYINAKLSNDGKLSFMGLAAKYGHPAERRLVITEDGYHLTLYHMQGDANRVVLLVHGNTADSDSWIIRGDTSLAITLARQGYDVWAINMRGTTASRKHEYLDPETEPDQFFDYSFYEQGYYDIPATIDYILRDTNQTQLLAVGHSIGTTVFYVMGAERPEYNVKIKAFISLAPICFLRHMKGIPAVSKHLVSVIKGFGKILGHMDILSKNQPMTLLWKAICLSPFGYELCVKNIFFQTFGPDEEGFEREFLPSMSGHYPAGFSSKMLLHSLQVLERNKLSRFDYGRDKNMEVYNSPEPPDIDLSKVTMKVALFVGKNDYLSSVSDVKQLRDVLPNAIHYQVMPYKKFNHADFVWGRHMPDNLYPYLLPLIAAYSQRREYSDKGHSSIGIPT